MRALDMATNNKPLSERRFLFITCKQTKSEDGEISNAVNVKTGLNWDDIRAILSEEYLTTKYEIKVKNRWDMLYKMLKDIEDKIALYIDKTDMYDRYFPSGSAVIDISETEKVVFTYLDTSYLEEYERVVVKLFCESLDELKKEIEFDNTYLFAYLYKQLGHIRWMIQAREEMEEQKAVQ